MLIGKLAKRTGASPKAIRLYEARGLLSPVERRGSYRVYTEQHFLQVGLIRQAQALGFSLTEFGSSLAGDHSEPDWAAVLQQLNEKRANIRKDIRMLEQLEVQLEQIGKEIQSCLAEAPILDPASCDDVTRPGLEKRFGRHA